MVTDWTVLVTGRDHGGREVAYVGDGVEPESSDSLRTFGAVLQALREHAGLSREEFAEQVRFSKHTVASVELGRRMPDESLVEASEGVLGNTGALRRAAVHLMRQPGLAAWFRQWARIEAAAITLYTYESRLIPGLLQTEAYARTLFTQQLPPLDDDQIEAHAGRLQEPVAADARGLMSTTELTWFKSSYSSGGDGDCIEVALSWHKSSYSGASGDDCLEVATSPTTIHIRDSKNRQGPALALSPAAWAGFLAYAGK